MVEVGVKGLYLRMLDRIALSDDAMIKLFGKYRSIF